MLLFIVLELASLPVILITLVYGVQVEKIRAIYFLVFFSFFSTIPFFFFLGFFFYNVFFFNMIFFFFKVDFFFIFFFIISFMVKFPLYFFHFWLPKIHVEARTLARIILAGLLLKFGLRGFFRFILFFSFYNLSIFFFFGFLRLFFSLIISLVQRDIKSLIAFSSITHISFSFLGLVFLRNLRKNSSLIVGLGHGFMSSLYF